MKMRLTPAQAAAAGIEVPYAMLDAHGKAARLADDAMLEKIIADLGKRNLRDQTDHETRWCAQRSQAFRAERRRRKALLPTPAR